MGVWTHIIGAVEADTHGRTSAESLYIAQTVVDHLPRVPGGEGDLQVYVTLKRGYNCSSTHDENDVRTDLGKAKSWGMFEHQTRVLITFQGDLRHTELWEATRDSVKMLNRLSKKLLVVRSSFRVIGFDRSVELGGKWLNENYEWEEKTKNE